MFKAFGEFSPFNNIGYCDSVGIRTQDPQLRRLLLYPAELRNQPAIQVLTCFAGAKIVIFYEIAKFLDCKSDIRTVIK